MCADVPKKQSGPTERAFSPASQADPRLGAPKASLRARLKTVCADWPSDRFDALVHQIATRKLRWQEQDARTARQRVLGRRKRT